MHLGNSIICPVTGIPMLAAMGIAAVYAFKKAKNDFKKESILPAIILTSFVFCLQMINFTIPQTGSSGHVIGAMLLAILLGPYLGFLSMCLILLVQAVFFADGGLMALGCNIFNMGFLACFIVYPFIYKPLSKNKFLASTLACAIALEIGAFAVCAEAYLSGSITSNAAYFLGLMQSIHLPIGIIEGIITSFIVISAVKTNFSKTFFYSISGVSLVLASIISQYASSKPDGLEWSLIKISDSFIAQTQGSLYMFLEALQAKISILSQVTSVAGNIIGLVVIAALSGLVYKLLLLKPVKVYDK